VDPTLLLPERSGEYWIELSRAGDFFSERKAEQTRLHHGGAVPDRWQGMRSPESSAA
jgi:hypothetical protein